MKIDFSKYSNDLELKENGIWFSKNTETISYPEDGNDLCLELEDFSFWFKHRNNCIIELVKRFSAKENFFDVGGGNGFVSLGLQNAGINVALLEPGISGVLNAKKRDIENVVCATTQNCGLASEFVANIGVFDVVEHIKDEQDFLRSCHAMLKSKGKIFVTVPAFNFLWSNEDDYSGHFRRYTTKTLKASLGKAGFKLVYNSYLFSPLPLPIYLMRTIPSKLNMHKNFSDKDKFVKEHKSSKSSGVLEKIWQWELNKVKSLSKIPFGSTVIAVAQKI
jgi:SAM-dependent methyltransferase